MKRFNSYLTGLAPWIAIVAGLGFITRFGVFSNSGVAPYMNYPLITGIAAGLYSLVMILHFCGVELSFLDYKTPEKNTLLNCFDASVVMTALLLLLKRSQEISGLKEAVIMCMISMAVAVLALIAERSGRIDFTEGETSGSRIGGRLLLALVFLAVCGLSVLTFNVAFSGVEKLSDALSVGLKATGNVLYTVLKYILIAIERFFEWLVSLFPGEEDMPLPPPEPIPGINPEQLPEYKNSIPIPVWVYYVLAAAAAILVIVFIARNIKFEGKLVTVNRNKRVKRSRTKKNNALEKLRAELRYRVCCIRYRRSVPGLLLYCEKHAPKGVKRLKGESGEGFLRRVSSAPEILHLAEMVEQQFYSNSGPMTVSREECRGIVNAWNAGSDIK